MYRIRYEQNFKKFEDCNKFSLAGKVLRYNISTLQEELAKEMDNINSEIEKCF